MLTKKSYRLYGLLLFVLLCHGPKGLYAQRGNFWFFADSAGIRFDGASVIPINNGSIAKGLFPPQSTIICDTSGQVLFYSTGENIWNRENQIMANGAGISTASNNGSNQIVAVPMPNNDSIYYLFYNKYNAMSFQNSLYYSVINTKRQNGLGEVVNRNVLLHNQNTTGITAIIGNNNRDYWLVTKYLYSPIFYSFKLVDTGIITQPVVTDFSIFSPNISLLSFCTPKASPDSRLISVNGDYFFILMD